MSKCINIKTDNISIYTQLFPKVSKEMDELTNYLENLVNEGRSLGEVEVLLNKDYSNEYKTIELKPLSNELVPHSYPIVTINSEEKEGDALAILESIVPILRQTDKRAIGTIRVNKSTKADITIALKCARTPDEQIEVDNWYEINKEDTRGIIESLLDLCLTEQVATSAHFAPNESKLSEMEEELVKQLNLLTSMELISPLDSSETISVEELFNLEGGQTDESTEQNI